MPPFLTKRFLTESADSERSAASFIESRGTTKSLSEFRKNKRAYCSSARSFLQMLQEPAAERPAADL
ncbi:hypothetical protein VSK91_08375 [Bacillus swezeyi]|uniref:hypothetical protein n=1 Tax=Bacillus swezeyi TaxID=1925020 RepID=UPI0039C6A8B9